MDEESEQCREVYAYYGLAMYSAQCLEREIVISLATVFGPGPQKITQQGYDRLLQSNFLKTMGQLITELHRKGDPSLDVGDIAAELQRAKEARNLLAHNYFWQRAVQFVSVEGRNLMLAELSDFVDLFVGVDKALTKLTLAWGELQGVTERDFQEAMDSLLEGKVVPQ